MFFATDNIRVQLTSGPRVAHLVLDVAGRSVNVFTPQVLAELETALDRVAAEASISMLSIESGKPGTFIAGADLHEFGKVKSAEEAVALSAAGQRVFTKLAALPVPSIAHIDGACLGGGLELALACDYREVVDHPKTQLGLPEIELGLLPAWGGTQRLPRVVGLESALKIILGGRRLKARDALAWGLADRIVPPEETASSRLAEYPKRPKTGLPLRTWRQRLLESTRLGRAVIYRGTERLLRRRLPDDMPAPWEALKAVRVGLDKGMEAGLAYEREAAGRLATSSACRNLIHLFLSREQMRKPAPELPRDDAPPIRRVGVVGAGAMGAGIAQLAALKGCEVVIQEVNETALAAGVLRILALFNKAVERGVLSAEEMPKKLANVHGTISWKGFADLDLAVEAIIENLEAKREIFRVLEEHTAPSTILATNTSSLRVQHLQEGLKHPGRVAGVHFFNPVHKMPLVEVVHTPATRPAVAAALLDWAAALGKTPVLVKDSPGFLVNRILMPYLNEAVLLVAEGLPVELADRAMRRFGMPMGPLELLDQVGLDVAADVAASMQPVFGDRFALNPAFQRMKDNGWLGQKSGLGFYDYRRDRKKVHEAAQTLLRDESRVAAPYQLEAAPPEQVMPPARERMVNLMVNEAAACLGEQLAASADEIDLAMVLGTGWAPHRGGPLRYGKDVGYATAVQSLTRLAEALGPRFEPCAKLKELSAEEARRTPDAQQQL